MSVLVWQGVEKKWASGRVWTQPQLQWHQAWQRVKAAWPRGAGASGWVWQPWQEEGRALRLVGWLLPLQVLPAVQLPAPAAAPAAASGAVLPAGQQGLPPAAVLPAAPAVASVQQELPPAADAVLSGAALAAAAVQQVRQPAAAVQPTPPAAAARPELPPAAVAAVQPELPPAAVAAGQPELLPAAVAAARPELLPAAAAGQPGRLPAVPEFALLSQQPRPAGLARHRLAVVLHWRAPQPACRPQAALAAVLLRGTKPSRDRHVCT